MIIKDKNIKPLASDWFIVSVNGKTGPMMWNSNNKFWAGFDGKTITHDKIDYWFNHLGHVSVSPKQKKSKFVITALADQFSWEDGNTAVISDPLCNEPADENGLYVRLCSFDTNKEHKDLEMFKDKLLKITIECLDQTKK